VRKSPASRNSTQTVETAATSIVVRFHPTNVTQEKYEESLRRLEESDEWPPNGLELHVLFGSEGDLK